MSTTTSAPPAPSELVTLTAASQCVDGVLLSDVVVTAVHDFPGGIIWLYYGVYLGAQFGIGSNQGLPPLASGQSSTVVQQIMPGPVRVEVRLEPEGDVIAEAEFDAPACGLPPTAPAISVAVERCADEDGGAFAVTMTNPPGGSESSFELFVYEAAAWPPEGDVEFWSYRSQPSVGDGEQETVIVDQLTLRSPDASHAGRVKPLAAGDYVIRLGWAVAEIGWVSTDATVFRSRRVLRCCRPTSGWRRSMRR